MHCVGVTKIWLFWHELGVKINIKPKIWELSLPLSLSLTGVCTEDFQARQGSILPHRRRVLRPRNVGVWGGEANRKPPPWRTYSDPECQLLEYRGQVQNWWLAITDCYYILHSLKDFLVFNCLIREGLDLEVPKSTFQRSGNREPRLRGTIPKLDIAHT